MLAIAKWIFLYSLLLLAPQVLDLLHVTDMPLAAGCGAVAIPLGILLLIAAGALTLRRPSLRSGGGVIAAMLSIVLTGVYSWWAANAWRGVRGFSLQSALLSFTALASVLIFWLIIRLRPREGIETRGYAVTFAPPRRGSDGPFMSPRDAR